MKASPNNNVIPIIMLGDIKGYTASDKPQARVGYVARVNYNFDNRYYIEFSGRYDASWKFISTKRWSFFPSVSGAWRITQEPFFKNNVKSDVLSDLKIRASYGVVGDDAVGRRLRLRGRIQQQHFGQHPRRRSGRRAFVPAASR